MYVCAAYVHIIYMQQYTCIHVRVDVDVYVYAYVYAYVSL